MIKYTIIIYYILYKPSDPLRLSAEGFAGVTVVAGCEEEEKKTNNKIKVIKKNRFRSREMERSPRQSVCCYSV